MTSLVATSPSFAINSARPVTQPPKQGELPLSAAGLAGMLSVGMPISYGIGYGIGWLGLSGQIPPTNFGMLLAVTLPARLATGYCIHKISGYKPDTPWRHSTWHNLTATVATSITSSAIAALACNQLGYEIDAPALIVRNIVGLGLQLGIPALQEKIETLWPELDPNEEMTFLDLSDTDDHESDDGDLSFEGSQTITLKEISRERTTKRIKLLLNPDPLVRVNDLQTQLAPLNR